MHVLIDSMVGTIYNVYIYQTITLYTLNTLRFCQLYFNKAEKTYSGTLKSNGRSESFLQFLSGCLEAEKLDLETLKFYILRAIPM